jgi:transposase
VSAETVRRRIRRFNAEGLAALEDHHRTGRPATYAADAVATGIAAALTSPRHLGLPFAAWTLDRPEAYLLEHKGIAMRRSRIGDILLKEGLRWAGKSPGSASGSIPSSRTIRGASRGSTPPRLRAA